MNPYQLSASPRRVPAVKCDHTASIGGLWPLSCQRSCQQLGADKEMHILDNSQTLNPLIWWHQLYLGCVFGHDMTHVYSPNSTGTCLFVKTLHNYVQIIAFRGDWDPTNRYRNERKQTTLAYRFIDGISWYLPSGIYRYLPCVR